MFRKLAIPAIAALTMAAGLTATPASAQSYHSGSRNFHAPHRMHAPHRICTPVYKWAKVRDRHGRGFHWQRVYAGQSCHWTFRR